MHFVSSSIYFKARHLAEQEGLPAHLLLPHNKEKEIAERAKYMPISLLFDMYEMAVERLSPGFSVRQGMQLNTEDYGTLGLSWKTCWRAREVLDRLERYMVLVTDHGEVKIDETQGITRIDLRRDAVRKGIETSNEVSLVMLTNVIREVTDKKIFPHEVSFKHQNAKGSHLEAYFNCPVRFGQAQNSLSFRTADIDIPTLKADASIHQFLVERMDEEKKGIHANADKLLAEIHKLVEEALPSGIPSAIQVADYLGMSARTLKRRLADKGLTFRDLVQDIQQKVCLLYTSDAADE